MSEDELAIPMPEQGGTMTEEEGEDMVEMGSVVGERSFLLDNSSCSEERTGFIQPLLSSTISVSPNTIALKDAEAVIKEAQETTRLLNQFNAIKNLCNSDLDNTCPLVTTMLSRDETSPTDAVRTNSHPYLYSNKILGGHGVRNDFHRRAENLDWETGE